MAKRLLVLLTALVALQAYAQYQPAPDSIRKILQAPPTPQVSVAPSRDRIILIERRSYPSIEEVSRPYLGLAGRRLDPATSGPHMPGRNTGYLVRFLDGREQRIQVPEGANLSGVSWAHRGPLVAFTVTHEDRIELCVADTDTGRVAALPGVKLNAANGSAYGWMPNASSLWVKLVPSGRRLPPTPRVPNGPVVQDADGSSAPVRTFQDLLQNDHDADLFETLTTSQLAIVQVAPGPRLAVGSMVGRPDMIGGVDPSPDGSRLLVDLVKRPFSFVLPASGFPSEVEVWTASGQVERTIADLPDSGSVPIGGVLPGPRGVRWVPNQDATLFWVEALDGGDPKATAEHRDRLVTLAAPFSGQPTEIARLEHRFSGARWFEGKPFMMVDENDRDRQRTTTHLLEPGKPGRKVWERSQNDRYGNPGSFVSRQDARGQSMVMVHGSNAYLRGQGSSPEGDRPFLDSFDLASFETRRIFRCAEGAYEEVVGLLSDDASGLLIQHETPTTPPNYFVQDASGRRALTSFEDPAPIFRQVSKQVVTYKRADGVDLSFTLYLPPNYVQGTRLPTVMWAYPREFTDTRTAGQITGSPFRFTSVSGTSPLFLALEGYAVLMDATIPIVGDPQTVNDTFIEQLVASAQAAIDKAVEMGVTDRNRVAVMGHSYGAFMTAHLLAHCDLFKTGVARSGAYNRTLTPFGFQSERRTLWEAPETYWRISPFMAADKINEPILFLHGTHDNNSGTFPMQSERMFAAVKANGGVARLVMLPYESHGYASIESVEHTHHETATWLDKYLKNGK